MNELFFFCWFFFCLFFNWSLIHTKTWEWRALHCLTLAQHSVWEELTANRSVSPTSAERLSVCLDSHVSAEATVSCWSTEVKFMDPDWPISDSISKYQACHRSSSAFCRAAKLQKNKTIKIIIIVIKCAHLMTIMLLAVVEWGKMPTFFVLSLFLFSLASLSPP